MCGLARVWKLAGENIKQSKDLQRKIMIIFVGE